VQALTVPDVAKAVEILQEALTPDGEKQRVDEAWTVPHDFRGSDRDCDREKLDQGIEKAIPLPGVKNAPGLLEMVAPHEEVAMPTNQCSSACKEVR